MTPRADAGAGAARGVLALALGLPLPHDVDWRGLLATAEREGCAPLCWVRSGTLIRRHAPRDVADAFRARTLAVAARTERQLATLAQVLATLERTHASPVVLKGAPLALRAHGDALVRQSADIDILVPRSARARARVALEADGWRCVQGAAPWEETWLRGDGATLEHLEVQSALLGEMLVHLEPATLPTTRVAVHGTAISELSPVALPAYLAVHLSRHRLAPLLWFVDLAALWEGMDPGARAEARRFAARHGLESYLQWGLSRVDATRRAAAGDARALRALGRPGADGRAIGHPAWRDLRFAPGPRSMARALAAWLVPPTTRDDRDVAVARIVRRLRRALGLTPGAARAAGPATPATSRAPGSRAPASRAPASRAPASRAMEGPPRDRALGVTRAELADVVETVASAGGTMWLRVRGRSMQPSIPSESLVRLVPPPARTLRGGEVALARLPDGSFALHRVLEERDGSVRLRGDAVVEPDPLVPRNAVLACADLMDAGAGVSPVPSREPVTLFRVLRPLRRLRTRLRPSRAVHPRQDA